MLPIGSSKQKGESIDPLLPFRVHKDLEFHDVKYKSNTSRQFKKIGEFFKLNFGEFFKLN